MIKKVKQYLKIINEIEKAAKIYQNNLVGNTYLYVFEKCAIEVVFRSQDFLHLTGVEIVYSAEQFYENILLGKVRPTQIYFSGRHPYRTCVKKLKNLINILDIIHTDTVILEEITTDTFIYKFGVTDLNFTICFSNDIDKEAKKVSDYLIARSLRTKDNFKKAKNIYEVNYILSKENDKPLYNKIEYSDNKYLLSELSEEILNKIDFTLL